MKGLLQLSLDKGFKTNLNKNKLGENKYNYLYLWELNKWLTDNYSISVFIHPDKFKVKFSTFSYSILKDDNLILSVSDILSSDRALEIGLYKALKLI